MGGPSAVVLKGALLPSAGGFVERDVLVEGGVVAGAWAAGGTSPARSRAAGPFSPESIDAGGKLLLPAFVDPHVHVREPGYDYKEDWETCSKAALKGGAACILDMPNNREPVKDYERIVEKRTIAFRKSYVNFGLYIALTDDNALAVADARVQGEICGVKVYLAETTGKIVAGSERALLELFRQPKPVLFHTGGVEGLSRALSVYAKASTRRSSVPPFYVCHVSTAEELSIIRAAKRSHPLVFAEVSPHHLLLDADSYRGLPGVLPPLSSRKDVEALWEGVLDLTIDTLGTDHAPHTVEEKRSEKAPSGFPGIETAMPLMLTAFRDRKLPIGRLVVLSSLRARGIFGIGREEVPAAGDAGRGEPWTREGAPADLALFEAGRFTVGEDGYATKCGWSPFHGWETGYRTSLTMVGGIVAYDGGRYFKPPIRCVSLFNAPEAP